LNTNSFLSFPHGMLSALAAGPICDVTMPA
jgi:hypothetical protein